MTVQARPNSVVIVGAGIVGFSVGWFLQEYGLEVTVVERDRPAAGSSWGNAGWISPGLAIPLPEPSVIRYGIKSLTDPTSALYVPFRVDPGLWTWLVRFALHCTSAQWERAMRGYLEINAAGIPAYDLLAEGGVQAPTHVAPLLSAFRSEAESESLRQELKMIREAGQDLEVEEISGDEARARIPQLAETISVALSIGGQRYIDPGAFVDSLAASFVARGGQLIEGYTVDAVRHGHGCMTVSGSGVLPIDADVVVLATGTWLSQLAGPLGVRTRVRAGRGYSMTVPTEQPVPGPVYLPAVRVACTPYNGGLRVSGTMEFAQPDAPLAGRRLQAIIDAATPLLQGLDWTARTDEWVGSRPVTPDGMALIGATADPGIYVAGGHGMWGITLGPATGKLLAEQIMTGRQPSALAPFRPLR